MTAQMTDEQPKNELHELHEDPELRRYAEHMEEFDDEAHGEQVRQGFLPMDTNAFDRVFISVVLYIALNLVWMRFIEVLLPLWIASVIGIGIGYYIVRYG